MGTKINSAGEQQPVDEKSRYAKMSTAALKEQLTIKLPDERLPRSLSARWANYEVLMPDGRKARFVEGSKLHNKEVFAGKGTRTPIGDIERIVREHKGTHEDWQKVKAIGTLELDGEIFDAEVHWYQNEEIGKKEEWKFKRYV